MKYLLLIALLFVTGCVGNKLVHTTYDKEGNILSVTEITNVNGFVNTETGVFAFGVEDGKFKLFILLLDRKIIESPESARAWGDAGANFMTGGASGAVKEALK